MIRIKLGNSSVKIGDTSAHFAMCYLLLVLFFALPTEVSAVGTWGGGEPPSSDDMYVRSVPWWLIPAGFVALLAQIMVFGTWPVQSFCVFVVIMAGVTVANRFGDTAGWISSGVTALMLYQWLFAEKKSDVPDHAAADKSEQVLPAAPPDTALARKPAQEEAGVTKVVAPSITSGVGDDQHAYARRISELREHIDNEARRHR